MIRSRILFRADGNQEIGLGHVMRCIALVQILQIKFECVFIIRDTDKEILRTIQTFCKTIILQSLNFENEVIELNSMILETDILVTDGYQFDSIYQKCMKSKIKKLVMIDDIVNDCYYADTIINHGNADIGNKYVLRENSKILAGPKYLIVREEFRLAAKKSREISNVKTVFICFGGADPLGITRKILTACIETEFISKIILITGTVNRNLDELTHLIKSSDKTIVFENNINASRMVELIKLSDFAICPSSTVSFEVCCVKCGLITGTYTENQYLIHKQLINSGSALSVDDFRSLTTIDLIEFLNKINDLNIIKAMIENQAKMIDGLSDIRFINEFTLLAEC